MSDNIGCFYMSQYILGKTHLTDVGIRLQAHSSPQSIHHSPQSIHHSPSPPNNTNSRTNYNNDAPTVQELKALIPLIFVNKKPLSNYFSQELFLSQHLLHLSENFHRLKYYRGSLSFLNKLSVHLLIFQKKLNHELYNLETHYQVVHHSMNLQILSNVQTFKNLNNSRIMINGLLNFKYVFQNFVQSLCDLDNFIFEINELIDEWNSNFQTTNDNNETNDINKNKSYSKLNTTIYELNNQLDELSSDAFDNLITNVIGIFSDYVETYFKANISDQDNFNYEILSLN